MIEHRPDESEAEDLLRATMREHAAQIDGEPARLLQNIQARRRQRRGLAVGLAAVATLVVAGGIGAIAASSGDSGLTQAGADPGTTLTSPTAPAGWVWRGAFGVEVAVPADWSLNDYGCNQTAAPSFVNELGGLMCLTPEPPTKELAIISELEIIATQPEADLFTGMPARDADLAGVPVRITEGQLADGRFAALIEIPSRKAYVSIRTLQQETTQAILASARVVETDHLGCPVQRPEISPDGAPATGIIDTDPVKVAVCRYTSRRYGSEAEFDEGVLVASAELDASLVVSLIAELRGGTPGYNPAPPEWMCQPDDHTAPNVVLLLTGPDAQVTRLWVTYDSCSALRGVDNGVSQIQVTQKMVVTFMTPLHTLYGLSADLPCAAGQPADVPTAPDDVHVRPCGDLLPAREAPDREAPDREAPDREAAGAADLATAG